MWLSCYLCLLLQTAFEVLSFVSVISNCWLLLLSPRLQELGQENGITGTNALLVAVLLEVTTELKLQTSQRCHRSTNTGVPHHTIYGSASLMYQGTGSRLN